MNLVKNYEHEEEKRRRRLTHGLEFWNGSLPAATIPNVHLSGLTGGDYLEHCDMTVMKE